MENERRYTVEEAAAVIGFRADDIAAILPDVGIDLTSPNHENGTLSEDEMARLSRLAEQIKKIRHY